MFKNFITYLFDTKKWFIFIDRFFSLIPLIVILSILWIFPFSGITSIFYAKTTNELENIENIEKEGKYVGITTTNSIQQRLKALTNEGLITNFIGVKLYIDNRKEEQIGEIQMYRIAIYMLENHLARNRGTGGANVFLPQARANIFSDYETPFFTSYTTRLNQTTHLLDSYKQMLIADYNKPINQKRAVFITNSDNLAEVIDKLKQQLQTNNAKKDDPGFFQVDNDYYRIRGNLIGMYYFLKGIEHDFKEKITDKTSYKDNFFPLIEKIEEGIHREPSIVITQMWGDLQKLKSISRDVANKLGEFRDKLRNG